MSGKEILVVNDEPPFRALIAFGLGCAGFRVVEAADAQAARARLADAAPDLLLMSSTRPATSSLQLTRALKEAPLTERLPIVILTTLGEETDRIAGLDSGADEYITAPIAPAEFIARIHAVLRRVTAATLDEAIRIDRVALDPVSHRVVVGTQRMHAPLLQYRLLEVLLKNPERVYTRSELADLIWGTANGMDERTVDVHMSRLRKILAAGGMKHLLQTVRGIGYRLSSHGRPNA